MKDIKCHSSAIKAVAIVPTADVVASDAAVGFDCPAVDPVVVVKVEGRVRRPFKNQSWWF